jgi:hypothetical protein
VPRRSSTVKKKAGAPKGHGFFRLKKTGAPLVRGPEHIISAGGRTSRARHHAPPAPVVDRQFDYHREFLIDFFQFVNAFSRRV